MFRYLAFVWDESDGRQAEAVNALIRRVEQLNPAWNDDLKCSGMSVFHTDARAGSSEVHRLNGIDGVVLGTVFERCANDSESVLAKKAFSAMETQQILSSGCRSLVTSCWGRYVAFVRDAASRRSFVLRDPTGGLPCYHMTFSGVEIFFSSMEDVVALGLAQLSISRDFIAARVALVFLNSRETALNEVKTLLAGERIEISNGRTAKSLVWNPLEVAQQAPIENAEEAARELRRVTKACIHSWAACYSTVLHKLSGGLDSSIVLGCLHDAPAKPLITCLNYYSAGCDGDERVYARAAAGKANTPLLELERSSAIHLEEILNIGLSAAPTFYLSPLQDSRNEARLAAETGATAYFSGVGGDQLFYQAQGILSAADYLHVHGLNRRFIEVALDAAHLERQSIWKVMKEAYRLRKPRRSQPASTNPASHRSLLTDAARQAGVGHNRFSHPSFESAQGYPPGKFWHAAGLCMPTEFYDPLGRPDDPEPVQPLMSQPLIELCLRIPTYVLTNSGWDRAIARRAFRTEVPREILRRRSKGGLEENVQEILMGNLRAARELLLDGHLVSAGLLHRGRVEEALSDRPTRTAATMAEIFDHLATEAWLRRWNRVLSTTTS